MKTARTVLAWLAAAAVLVFGFAWLAGWFNERVAPGETPRRKPATADRRTAEVTAQEIDTFLPVPGRLWAENRTRVTSEIVGKISEIAVVAGDRVEVGDTLVELDQTELLARASRIRETLPAQQVRVKEAQAEYDRDRRLLEDAAVPREQVETSRRRLAEAKANLAAAEQRLAEAEGQLQEAVINATMSGTVVDRLAKVGEVARPGEPLLEIYQPATLRLESSVPESLVGGLRVDQDLPAEIGSSREKRTVTIDEIVPQSDSHTRTVLVKARVPDAVQLFEGQYGRLFVPLARAEKIIVPAAAVQSLGQLDFVEVVTERRGVERRFVKRGRVVAPNRIEILSGLEAGQRVTLTAEPRSSSSSWER